MSLKKCKECGADISSSAKACPQCGKKQKNKAGVIAGVIILLMLIASGNNNNNINHNTNNTISQTNSNNTISISTNTIEPNTTAMVESIILKAREDSKTASEGKILEALNFIKENIDNFFVDNETMEKGIYYGALLEYKYNGGKANADIKGEIGMDTVQAIKYVYRNAEKPEDISTQSNIEQIKKNLNKLN